MSEHLPAPQLVGSIIERQTKASPHHPIPTPTSLNAESEGAGPSRGFPAVQHRSKTKSAFARAREDRARAIAAAQRGQGEDEGNDDALRLERPPTLASASAPTSSSQSGSHARVPDSEGTSAATSSTSTQSAGDHANPKANAEAPRSTSIPVQTEDEWRAQMSAQNAARVANMSDAEREAEREEILAKFGSGIGDVLQRARARRAREQEQGQAVSGNGSNIDQSSIISEPTAVLSNSGSATVISSTTAPSTSSSSSDAKGPTTPPNKHLSLNTSIQITPPSSKSTKATRPSTPISALAGSRPATPSLASLASPSARKLRFADVTDNDVHVYESAPSSPKRRALALPPPTEGDNDVVSLGTFVPRGTIASMASSSTTSGSSPSPDPPRSSSADSDATISSGSAVLSGSTAYMPPRAPPRGNPIPTPTGLDEDDSMELVNGDKEENMHHQNGKANANEDEDEDTPASIRKRFFPTEPTFNPSLAWMMPSVSQTPSSPSTRRRNSSSSQLDPGGLSSATSSSGDPATSDLRLSLTGHPIPSSLSLSLPTHLGLHHHAEGTRAGYTLPDVFVLARSTVRAQRAAMVRVLCGAVGWMRTPRTPSKRNARRAGAPPRPSGVSASVDEDVQAEIATFLASPDAPRVIKDTRKKALAIALLSLPEQGSLGALALELLYTLLVGNDDENEHEHELAEEVELQDRRRSAKQQAADPTGMGVGNSDGDAAEDEPGDDDHDLRNTLPFEHLLPQLAVMATSASSSSNSNMAEDSEITSNTNIDTTRHHILSILLRLASHSNALAQRLVEAPGLVPAVLQAYLLTPIPVLPASDLSSILNTSAQVERIHKTTHVPLPDLRALHLLRILAASSRTAALTLLEPADALLRFLAAPPNTSPFGLNVSIKLAAATLRLYAQLARFGVYAGVVTGAGEPLRRVVGWIVENAKEERRGTLQYTQGQDQSQGPVDKHQKRSQEHMRSRDAWAELASAWCEALEAWYVCARDPHQTTPEHELTWSRIAGAGWQDDVLDVLGDLAIGDEGQSRDGQDGEDEDDGSHVLKVWAAGLHALGAYLEGARINGAKGGEEERTLVGVALRRLGASSFPAVAPARDSGKLNQDGTAITNLVRRATMRLRHILEDPMQVEKGETPLGRLAQAKIPASVLAGAMRVWLGCVGTMTSNVSISANVGAPTSSSTAVPTSALSSMSIHPAAPFDLTSLMHDVSLLCATLVRHPLWAAVQSPTAPVWAYSLTRPLSYLLGLYLRVSHVQIVPLDTSKTNKTDEHIRATATWTTQAVSILGRLQAGDEEVARWTIREVVQLSSRVAHSTSVTASVPEEVWMKMLDVGLPFWGHGLNEPSVAPLHPESWSLKIVKTLRLPALGSIDASKKRRFSGGLPLSRDWVFTPIQHLLRSGSSTVFKALPEQWDADEKDVVKVALGLAITVQATIRTQGINDSDNESMTIGREDAIFGAMGVFMLEHGLPEDELGAGATEVWRDEVVQKMLGTLLGPHTLAGSRPSVHSTQTTTQISSNQALVHYTPLETAALPFLGPGTPFFQFFSDFMALFENTSFGHPLFAALVLPPLGMRYAVDYRILVWKEHAPAVRMLRAGVGELFASPIELRGWLWPVEEDREVKGGMVRALVRGELGEGTAVRWIAVHHVACTIWPDLRQPVHPGNGGGEADTSVGGSGNGSEKAEENALALLRAVVTQGSFEVVREVVGYWQDGEEHNLVMPPRCFELNQERKESRSQWLRGAAVDVLDRVKGILE